MHFFDTDGLSSKDLAEIDFFLAQTAVLLIGFCLDKVCLPKYTPNANGPLTFSAQGPFTTYVGKNSSLSKA